MSKGAFFYPKLVYPKIIIVFGYNLKGRWDFFCLIGISNIKTCIK